MRYWVFSDARILGPYSREELAGMEAVHSGTLVCLEGASGVADGDWRALESVPELAGLALAAATAGGLAASPFSETLDPADVHAAAWPPPFEDDPRFGFWLREEAGATRASQLESSLAEMREQLARHERRQDEILDRLNAKDALISEREREIAELRARLTLFETGQIPVARLVAPAPAQKSAPPAPDRALSRGSGASEVVEAPKVDVKAPPSRVEAKPVPRIELPKPVELPPPAVLEPVVPEPEPVLEAPPPAPEAPAPLQMESALEASGGEESPARAALRAARQAKAGLPATTGPMEIALPEAAPAAIPEPEALAPEPAPAMEAPAPVLETPAPALEEAPALGIPESEQLSPVAEMPPPLEFAAPYPEDIQAAPPPLGAPLEPPPGFVDPNAPPPMPEFADPAFAPQPQPQQPGQFLTPQTVIFQGQGAGLNLTPSPIPLMTGPGGQPVPFGATPEPIPLGDPGALATPMPAMGQPDLPQTVMQGLGVAGQATPFPFGAQTPLPRLPGQETGFDAPITAMPRPQPTSPGEPPAVPPTGAPAATKPSALGRLKEALRSKKFVIILAASVLALFGILAMFLRNPKQLAKTVDMAPEQKAPGSFESEDAAPAPAPRQASPFQQKPAETEAEAAPAPKAAPEAAPAPAPKAAPAAPPRGRDYISDHRIEAIEFVKNYKLDEARGTISAYLQYAFLGPDTEPAWEAGAVEGDVYLVQFNVYKRLAGGRGRKPTYSYRFEVDLARKTLAPANPSAKEMLGPAKPAARRPARRKRASAGSAQEPLPGDAELEGASGDPAGFNNPGG